MQYVAVRESRSEENGRPASQRHHYGVGDGDVSIAALTSGAHGASFRRAGFRDVGARFSEKHERERPSRLLYTISFTLYQRGK